MHNTQTRHGAVRCGTRRCSSREILARVVYCTAGVVAVPLIVRCLHRDSHSESFRCDFGSTFDRAKSRVWKDILVPPCAFNYCCYYYHDYY